MEKMQQATMKFVEKTQRIAAMQQKLICVFCSYV